MPIVNKSYDVVVVGSGPAGIGAALAAAPARQETMKMYFLSNRRIRAGDAAMPDTEAKEGE